jgi:hypothetical protein
MTKVWVKSRIYTTESRKTIPLHSVWRGYLGGKKKKVKEQKIM